MTDLAEAYTGQTIRLQNPVSQHYETFIFGNSVTCCALPRPDPPHKEDGTECGAACTTMLQPETATGQTLILCGAGPTLRDNATKWVPRGDQVWGCNSALTWLYEEGYPVTHGITVDQTPHMMLEWESTPPVEYLLATTAHPSLTGHLLKNERRITWFHNYVGIKKPPVEYDGQIMAYEDWMYCALFPPSFRAGAGLNTLTRAIDVALAMDFERIIVLGADCALKVNKKAKKGTEMGTPEHTRWLTEDVEMHADGGSALASEATEMTLTGKIDGREWLTKPDMMISAVWLERWRRLIGRRKLTLIGDTLPNALQHKSDEYLDRLPSMPDSNGKPIGPSNI